VIGGREAASQLRRRLFPATLPVVVDKAIPELLLVLQIRLQNLVGVAAAFLQDALPRLIHLIQ
jgi:hypothetical protein